MYNIIINFYWAPLGTNQSIMYRSLQIKTSLTPAHGQENHIFGKAFSWHIWTKPL